MTEQRVEFVISAGAGGPDSSDWAALLFRAYLCWALRQGADPELIWAHRDGAHWAGMTSAKFSLPTVWAESLAVDCGVHRLVRKSPFDPQSRRHTSFAALTSDELTPSGPSQVRTYFLHPEERVKDYRTDMETPHARRVLDGEFELIWGSAS